MLSREASGIFRDALAAALLAGLLAVPFLGFRMEDSAQGLSLSYRFAWIAYAALAVFAGRLALGFASRHWGLMPSSPRFKLPAVGIVVVVGAHLRAVPLFLKRRQPRPQFVRFGGANPACGKFDLPGREKRHQHACFGRDVLGLLGQLDVAVSVNARDRGGHDT